MPSDFSVRRDRIYHIAAICEHAFCREPASTHATFQSWCTLFIRDVRNLLQAMFFEADRDPNANIVVPPFVVCLAVEDKRARGDTENPYYNPANLSMYGSRREPFGIWLVDEQYVVPHMVGWWSAYPLNPQRLRYLSQETKASAESALGSYEERTSTYHKLSFMLPLSQPSKPAAAAATHAIPPSTSSRVAGMEPTHSHSCSEPQHQVVSDDAMQLQHPSSPSSASRVPPPPTPPVIAVSTQPPTPLSSYEVRNNENRLQNGENHSNLTDLLSASSRGMELEQDPHPIGVDEPSPDSMIAANNEQRSSSRVPAGEANGKCDAVFRSIATRQSLPDKPTTLTESRKPSKKSFDVNTVAESHRCRLLANRTAVRRGIALVHSSPPYI
ncbi:hypothetical protein C8Q80DRAFT_940021 [Daedaleopsis nitida]|nr:hypothetical protein C8Q80DRAFT_940021 [Daedaleopsis nitida]